MKKLILSSFLIAATLFVVAQTKTDSTIVKKRINGNNEIKVNLFNGLSGMVEITYERIINEESAIGVSLTYSFDEPRIDFGAIPYYRIYFGNKKASGFFIEGNSAIVMNSRDYRIYDYTGKYPTTITKHQTSFGLGAATGGKFLTKNGFIGEGYIGVGRLFKNDQLDIYPRLGITLGKRF